MTVNVVDEGHRTIEPMVAPLDWRADDMRNPNRIAACEQAAWRERTAFRSASPLNNLEAGTDVAVMSEVRARRLCVYCGSRLGEDPIYREKAREFGRAIAEVGIRLVYGGGGSGLMGVIARSAKLSGGHVTGIIPTSLLETEEVLEGIDECHVVSSYHERKTLMLSLSDGFAAFPGGPGTLEELAEQLALAERGYHDKPIYIINISGYWDRYLAVLDKMHEELFTIPGARKQYIVVEEPKELIPQFLRL